MSVVGLFTTYSSARRAGDLGGRNLPQSNDAQRPPVRRKRRAECPREQWAKNKGSNGHPIKKFSSVKNAPLNWTCEVDCEVACEVYGRSPVKSAVKCPVHTAVVHSRQICHFVLSAHHHAAWSR